MKETLFRQIASLKMRFNAYKHAIFKKIIHALPPRKELLFIFTGYSNYWPEMGRELYDNEPAFKESINESRKIISELCGDEVPLIYSAGNSPKSTHHKMYSFTAVQIALYDLLLAKHIAPHSIAGISLGEIAANYATGVLTKAEAYMIVNSLQVCLQKERSEYISIVLSLSFDQILSLNKRNSVSLHPVYSIQQNRSIILVHRNEFEEANTLFTNKGIHCKKFQKKYTHPFHTELLTPHEETINSFLKDVNPKPLQIDYYSASLGQKIQPHRILGSNFGYEMQRLPVNAYQVLEELKRNRKNYQIVQIGPDLIGTKKITRKSSLFNFGPSFFSTLELSTSELSLFKETEKGIRKIGNKISRKKNKTSSLNAFLSNYPPLTQDYFNNPLPYLKFLRGKGQIHYIPFYYGYLILSYDAIEFVLKNPDKFSNSPYTYIEKVLIGADLPEHTKTRALLQPHFSRRALNEIEKIAQEKAESLINTFPVKKSINFVDAFSIPYVTHIIEQILDFSPEEQSALEKKLNDYHMHSLNYLEDLLDFMMDFLSYRTISGSQGLVKSVLQAIEDKQFSKKNAAKLLRFFWLAGTTTTSAVISFGLNRLLDDPTLARKLINQPDLTKRFIQECARLETPETFVHRIATQDVQLEDTMISKGSRVYLNFLIANRDKKYFDDPDSIRLDRTFTKHLAFGGGIHHCIGLPLANLEAGIAIKTILNILPEINKTPGKSPSYYPSLHQRSLKELDITLMNNFEFNEQRTVY